jgi:hypothetical protein
MGLTHTLTARFIRWISSSLCLSLILTSLAIFPSVFVKSKGIPEQGQNKQEPKNDKARKAEPRPPRKGAPAGTLPNLDEVRQRREPEPEAPAAIPSNTRSKRRPQESRKGKRVGDPGTTGNSIGYRSSDRDTSARSHHMRTKARATAPPPLADDQFIQNFFYWAFLRYPNSTEQAYWNDILRTAYSQGQSAMLIAMRELGMTVFESAEYAGRNRSNQSS